MYLVLLIAVCFLLLYLLDIYLIMYNYLDNFASAK